MEEDAKKWEEQELNRIVKISKSGYGGVLYTGEIVDRREHPDAVPIPENTLFEIPEPIDITQ